jgi:pimeloyl-ACP methyl ester carboxylesterase
MQHGLSRRDMMLTTLAFTSGCATAAAPGTAEAPLAHPTMERRLVTVPGGGSIDADFGRFTVPAVRRDPNSGTFDLAFVWLRSPIGAGQAPTMFLAGGPGDSSTWMAGNEYGMSQLAPLLAAGDVILLDQRGTGQSRPPSVWLWDGPPALTFFVSEEIAMAHFREGSRRAIAALAQQGVRLDGFTTEEAADDVNDLRRALGLERVSIWGFSYGTHLGLSVLRRHGRHIERAILIGVEGPDDTYKPPLGMDRAYDRIARMAAADPNVAAAGDLWELRDRVRAKLACEQMAVEIQGGDRRYTLPVGPFGLDIVLRLDIGDASDIPVFPRLLQSIDQGDTRLLRWFVQKRAGLVAGIPAMSFMTDAASGASAERLALIARETPQSRFGNIANFPFPDLAEEWRAPALAPDFRDPVRSSAPTLFMCGELDWNTPPAQAHAAARRFRNATVIIVGNAGHEQVYTHPDIKSAMTRFLRGEDVSGVAASHPPVRFVPLQDGVAGAPTHPAVPSS